MLRHVTALSVLIILTACGGEGTPSVNTTSASGAATGTQAAMATVASTTVTTATTSSVLASPYSIGVYYYPGWTKGAPVNYVDGYWCPGGTGNDPWCTIYKYPEREPKHLSWYQDNQVETLRKQVQLMSESGIHFVMFDWYVGAVPGATPLMQPKLDQSLKAFKQAPKPAGFKFALAWDNAIGYPKTLSDFDTVMSYQIAEFKEPNNTYLKTADGKPIVNWLSVEDFQNMYNAIKVGNPEITSPNVLLHRFRTMVTAAGFPGVHVVIGLLPTSHWLYQAKQWGFDAISAYNYHQAYTGDTAGPLSESYRQLDDMYRHNWTQAINSLGSSGMKYYVPTTTGWNKKPWQPRDVVSSHDNSWGNEVEFREHLLAARRQMDSQPAKTGNITVICCWNEYGEGSILEPIKGRANDFLAQIKSAFYQ